MPRLLSLPWGDRYTIEGLTVRKCFLIFCHNFPILRLAPFYLSTCSWAALPSFIAMLLKNIRRASTIPTPNHSPSPHRHPHPPLIFLFWCVQSFLLGIKHIKEKFSYFNHWYHYWWCTGAEVSWSFSFKQSLSKRNWYICFDEGW